MRNSSCIAILAATLSIMSCSSNNPQQVDLSKAIDLEHHFFVQDYIDYVKARTDFPFYREGEGIYYHGTSFLPIDIKTAFCFSDAAKNLKTVDIVTDLDDVRIAELEGENLEKILIKLYLI